MRKNTIWKYNSPIESKFYSCLTNQQNGIYSINHVYCVCRNAFALNLELTNDIAC